MRDLVLQWLELLGLANNEMAYFWVAVGFIAATAIVVHLVLHKGVIRFLSRESTGKEQVWRRALKTHKLFTRVAFMVQGLLLIAQARLWLAADAMVLPVVEVATNLWVLLFALLAFYSLLNTLEQILFATRSGRRLPLRGISQGLKLVATGIAAILAVSLLIGKSPVILFSGLGAMTAVLMLVFKDPLMGLVAGIQLSANNMLAVGDWLEMPKYGADGDVIDIGLTTVKVQNWDRTITTVPSYALIADSFKNWRGMQESGGRRIKRAINIDATSVHFLDEEELQRLRNLQLLTDYIENKVKEVEEYNREHNINPASPANGRHLTNLGTFRAYLMVYLREHPRIHKGLIQMVRQLAPGPEGVPMEVYAFTNDTAWANYEGIQSDIFDHIFAVLPEFGLRLHQTPTGHDMRRMVEKL